jgi:hypothetical protein
MTKATPGRIEKIPSAPSAKANAMLAALSGRKDAVSSGPVSETSAPHPPLPLGISSPGQDEVRKASQEVESKPIKRTKKVRPSRTGRRFMGGFFPPEVHKAMGYVMVEEDKTLQELMEEAVHDFLVRKGQGKRLR